MALAHSKSSLIGDMNSTGRIKTLKSMQTTKSDLARSLKSSFNPIKF